MYAYSVSWGRQAERPLVIAHRGASADAVENTMAAFRLAREEGADGVELDVMRCASGEIVVFHDDDLERLGKRAGLTRAASLAELREIDLGGGERIPLLDEVLEELGPLLVNVELKSQSKLADDGLAAAVAAILRRHAARARALVSSFDPLLLARFRLRAPDLPTGLLFAHDQSLALRRAWAAPLLRPAALHPEAALVDALRVRAWHARGYALNVWTVDDPAELRLLAALGVDGVITNRPKFARSVLQSR
ncbi:MAG TPA: glycerophosphodiester phosphodiesterase [Polyangia bacterium]